MAVADVSQAIASMQEHVRPELVDLSLSASTLWKRIEENTKIKAVSTRPFRIPTMPIRGGKGRRGSLDNQDMGVGSGPQEVPGTGSCVTHDLKTILSCSDGIKALFPLLLSSLSVSIRVHLWLFPRFLRASVV